MAGNRPVKFAANLPFGQDSKNGGANWGKLAQSTMPQIQRPRAKFGLSNDRIDVVFLRNYLGSLNWFIRLIQTSMMPIQIRKTPSVWHVWRQTCQTQPDFHIQYGDIMTLATP